MEPVLLHFKEREFEQHINAYQDALDALNAVLTTYETLNLKELSLDGFKSLINYPFETMFDILTEGKEVNIGGLKLDKKKALEIIQKPKGFDELQARINKFKSTAHHAHIFNNVEFENSQLILTKYFIEREKKPFEVWATSENSIKAYNFINKVMDAATEEFGEDKINIPRTVATLLRHHAHSAHSNGQTRYKNSIIAQRIVTFMSANDYFNKVEIIDHDPYR